MESGDIMREQEILPALVNPHYVIFSRSNSELINYNYKYSLRCAEEKLNVLKS